MLERFKRLNSNEKGMMILIVILLLFLMLRWDYVKEQVKPAFEKYFKKERVGQ